MPQPDPLTQAAHEVTAAIRSRKKRVADWVTRWLGTQLVVIAAGAVGAGGLLWVAFPWAVAVGACLVVAAAVVYAVYVRKQLVEERMMRRRAFVGGKRVLQRALQSELTLRQIAIGLAGNPGERRRLYDARTPGAQEVRQAADYVAARARAHVASVDTSSQAEAARRRGRAPAPPRAPNVQPWIRRAVVLVAEIEELDAEIQTLSVPDSPDLESALMIAKEKKQAAHQADRVAQDRHHAGQTPSPAEPGAHLAVSVGLDGTPDVRQTAAPRTPEQIADGDGLTDLSAP